MPTPLSPTEKSNFIDIVKVAPYPGGPTEAAILETILNNYEDVANAIYRQLDLFAQNNGYLVQVLSVLNNNSLLAAGIYFQREESGVVVNPVLVVNSKLTGNVQISASGVTSPPTLVQQQIPILGSSEVNLVTVDLGIRLKTLYIGPGAVVDLADSNKSDDEVSPPVFSFIENIVLPFFKSTPAILKGITFGSFYGSVNVTPGSYFGGVIDYDPDASCLTPVTDIAVGEITKDSVMLLWNPPANFVFINIFFREDGATAWIPATEATGDYFGTNPNGYTFRHLKADTFYNFMVQVVCINGGRADVIVNAQTICCGSGSVITGVNCYVEVTIKDSPDSTKKTLCNGVEIDAQYPSGTTLTIPYFANKPITDALIIDNAYVQGVPFNTVLGKWDFVTTPVGILVDGNVVGIKVQLPFA